MALKKVLRSYAVSFEIKAYRHSNNSIPVSHMVIYDVGGNTMGSVDTKLRNLFILSPKSGLLHILHVLPCFLSWIRGRIIRYG